MSQTTYVDLEIRVSRTTDGDEVELRFHRADSDAEVSPVRGPARFDLDELIHALEGHAHSVFHAAWSGDATRVLTASADNTARIWAGGGTEHLQGRIRASTGLCLPADFRQRSLGEPPEEAERHVAACEACVPAFFERLEGVERWEVEPYAAAWREYRACLDERD